MLSGTAIQRNLALLLILRSTCWETVCSAFTVHQPNLLRNHRHEFSSASHHSSPTPRSRQSILLFFQDSREVFGSEQTTSTIIDGAGSRDTWRFDSPEIEGVQVVLQNDGRPLHAEIDLWEGPYDTPQRIELYSENGASHPLCTILETPALHHVIGIRNNGELTESLAAGLKPDDSSGPVAETAPDFVEGGCSRNFDFAPPVSSVRVLLQTDGCPMDAQVEVVQGDSNHVMQVVNVQSEDGMKSPFFAMINTPGPNNFIRVTSRTDPGWPAMNVYVEPYLVEPDAPHSSPYDSSYHQQGFQDPPTDPHAGFHGPPNPQEPIHHNFHQNVESSFGPMNGHGFDHFPPDQSIHSPGPDGFGPGYGHPSEFMHSDPPVEDPGAFAAEAFENNGFEDIYGGSEFGRGGFGPGYGHPSKFMNKDPPVEDPGAFAAETFENSSFEDVYGSSEFASRPFGHSGDRHSAAKQPQQHSGSHETDEWSRRQADFIYDEDEAHIFDAPVSRRKPTGPDRRVGKHLEILDAHIYEHIRHTDKEGKSTDPKTPRQEQDDAEDMDVQLFTSLFQAFWD